MSDYYDDSFESDSGSENGEEGEGEAGSGVPQAVQSAATSTTRELQVAPNLLASPRLSAALRGNGSASDLEEQEPSRWR